MTHFLSHALLSYSKYLLKEILAYGHVASNHWLLASLQLSLSITKSKE